jgi:ribosomal RNA-processing protein 17
VREINALMVPATAAAADEDDGEAPESDGEWSGITDPEPPPIDHEAEYIDEDKYTTVTVEAMDVTREGLFKAEQEEAKEDEKQAADTSEEPTADKKRKWTKDKPKDAGHKTKKKKRNFRYESKAERKATRSKERSKNHKQARERKSG